MALVVDSSVFVEAERRGLELPAIVRLIEEGEPLYVAAITISEMLLGVHLGAPVPRQVSRLMNVEDIIQDFPILDFDLAVARTYADLWALLRFDGNLIPPHDLMISATAIAHGLGVLTHNVRHFIRIPGLTVRQPAW